MSAERENGCGGTGRVLTACVITDGENRIEDCTGCSHPRCPVGRTEGEGGEMDVGGQLIEALEQAVAIKEGRAPAVAPDTTEGDVLSRERLERLVRDARYAEEPFADTCAAILAHDAALRAEIDRLRTEIADRAGCEQSLSEWVLQEGERRDAAEARNRRLVEALREAEQIVDDLVRYGKVAATDEYVREARARLRASLSDEVEGENG